MLGPRMRFDLWSAPERRNCETKVSGSERCGSSDAVDDGWRH